MREQGGWGWRHAHVPRYLAGELDEAREVDGNPVGRLRQAFEQRVQLLVGQQFVFEQLGYLAPSGRLGIAEIHHKRRTKSGEAGARAGGVGMPKTLRVVTGQDNSFATKRADNRQRLAHPCRSTAVSAASDVKAIKAAHRSNSDQSKRVRTSPTDKAVDPWRKRPLVRSGRGVAPPTAFFSCDSVKLRGAPIIHAATTKTSVGFEAHQIIHAATAYIICARVGPA